MPKIGKPFIPQEEFSKKDGWFVGPIVPDALMEYGGLSLSAKVVWIVLASCAGRDGKCYPSCGTIARKAAISVRTVHRALAELRDQGFIGWDPGGLCKDDDGACTKKSNYYRFLWHPIFEEAKIRAGVKAWIDKPTGEAAWEAHMAQLERESIEEVKKLGGVNESITFCQNCGNQVSIGSDGHFWLAPKLCQECFTRQLEEESCQDSSANLAA